MRPVYCISLNNWRSQYTHLDQSFSPVPETNMKSVPIFAAVVFLAVFASTGECDKRFQSHNIKVLNYGRTHGVWWFPLHTLSLKNTKISSVKFCYRVQFNFCVSLLVTVQFRSNSAELRRELNNRRYLQMN